MKKPINVSVTGGTGIVWQNFLLLLDNHPWFRVVDIAASKDSAGKKYIDAVRNKWSFKEPVPEKFRKMIVRESNDYESIPNNVSCVFFSTALKDRKRTSELEFNYARKGIPVVSTTSSNRTIDDVPVIIPEINPEHLNIIPEQQKNHGLPDNGYIVSKPNCSIQSFVIVLKALKDSGYTVNRVQVSTMQALSGAGYNALTDHDMKNNVIPYIKGEEYKTENEPLKIFGKIDGKSIVKSKTLKVNAICTRVPTFHGHMALVQLGFSKKKPTKFVLESILEKFKTDDLITNLPSAPKSAIVVKKQIDRPQPRLDINIYNGMTVTVGRIEEDKFFDYRFIGLSHNLNRGASGGAILIAELLAKRNLM